MNQVWPRRTDAKGATYSMTGENPDRDTSKGHRFPQRNRWSRKCFTTGEWRTSRALYN